MKIEKDAGDAWSENDIKRLCGAFSLEPSDSDSMVGIIMDHVRNAKDIIDHNITYLLKRVDELTLEAQANYEAACTATNIMPKTQSDPQLRTHETEFLRNTVKDHGNNLAPPSMKNLIDQLERRVRATGRKLHKDERGNDDDDGDEDDYYDNEY